MKHLNEFNENENPIINTGIKDDSLALRKLLVPVMDYLEKVPSGDGPAGKFFDEINNDLQVVIDKLIKKSR
jgi:hypothetical protein